MKLRSRAEGSSLKDACQKMSASSGRKNDGFFDYLDKMQESLNKNIQDNVFPNWRQHPSLKGK